VSERSTRPAADVGDRSPLVLVVDDDADVRSTIAETLEDEGYRVAQAANGIAAHDMLRRGGTPALILLDLWMPVLDGWGFLERRALDPTIAAIPVIVMSASPFERHVPGVQQLLKKPIRFEVLLDAVAAAVEPNRDTRAPSVPTLHRARPA
jgi:CheY-like chemotaxis protein